jgi:hypothetical protein
MDVAVTAPRLQNLPNAYAATHLSASTRFGSNQRAHVSIFRSARVAPEKAVFRPALPLRSAPGLNGTTMTKLSYGEQLKHPNWQRKRLEVLNRAEFKCERCFGGEETLHVHHKRYVKGRQAWEYDAQELLALCASCHECVHEEQERLGDLFARLPADGPFSAPEAAAIIAGWAYGRVDDAITEAFAGDPWGFNLGMLAQVADKHMRIMEICDLVSAMCDADFREQLAALVKAHLAKGANA